MLCVTDVCAHRLDIGKLQLGSTRDIYAPLSYFPEARLHFDITVDHQLGTEPAEHAAADAATDAAVAAAAVADTELLTVLDADTVTIAAEPLDKVAASDMVTHEQTSQPAPVTAATLTVQTAAETVGAASESAMQ